MNNSLGFLKQCTLALTIAFLVPILVYQGIKTVYPQPVLQEKHNNLEQNPRSEFNHLDTNGLQQYFSRFFLFEFIASCFALGIGLCIGIDSLAAGFIMGAFLTLISALFLLWQYLSSSTLLYALFIFLCVISCGGYYHEKRNQAIKH